MDIIEVTYREAYPGNGFHRHHKDIYVKRKQKLRLFRNSWCLKETRQKREKEEEKGNTKEVDLSYFLHTFYGGEWSQSARI